MSLRLHAAWAAGAAILLTASRFLLLAVLARRLDSQALGLFAYAQWMVDIGFLVAAFGANGAASRYIAEFRSRPGLLHAFMRVWRLPSLLLPLAASALATLGAYLSGIELGALGYGALLAWALFAGLWAMQTAALMGLQRFDLVFLANLLAAAAMVLGAAFLPMASNDPSSAFLIMGAGCAAAFAVGVLPVHRLGTAPTGQAESLDRPSIIRYCANVWVTALLWSLVWSRGEVPLVRHYLGDAQLASYSVALSLVGGAIAGVMLGLGGIAPQVTRFLGDGLEDKAVGLCRMVGDWQLMLSGSAAAVIIWLSPEILSLAFGPGYASAAPALGLLAAGLPALSFSMHNHLLQIQTGARFNRNTTLLGLAVLSMAAVLLIPRFGIEGAALARVMALWLLAMVSAAVFSARVDPRGVNRSGLAAVMLVTGASATAVALLPAFPLGVRVSLAIGIPTALLLAIRGRDGRLAVGAMLQRATGP